MALDTGLLLIHSEIRISSLLALSQVPAFRTIPGKCHPLEDAGSAPVW